MGGVMEIPAARAPMGTLGEDGELHWGSAIDVRYSNAMEEAVTSLRSWAREQESRRATSAFVLAFGFEWVMRMKRHPSMAIAGQRIFAAKHRNRLEFINETSFSCDQDNGGVRSRFCVLDHAVEVYQSGRDRIGQ